MTVGEARFQCAPGRNPGILASDTSLPTFSKLLQVVGGVRGLR